MTQCWGTNLWQASKYKTRPHETPEPRPAEECRHQWLVTSFSRAAEKASIHSQSMETEDAQVMKVYQTNRAKEPARQKECLFCGYLHAPKGGRFPAYGKLCNACKEKDHFESKCPYKDRRAPKQRSNISKRSKCIAPRPRVHYLDISSEDGEDEYAHWVNTEKSRKKQRKDAKCLMLLDK